MVPRLGWGIANLDWWQTILYAGIFVGLVSLPVSLVIRSKPEDLSLLPDCDRQSRPVTKPDIAVHHFEDAPVLCRKAGCRPELVLSQPSFGNRLRNGLRFLPFLRMLMPSVNWMARLSPCSLRSTSRSFRGRYC